MDYNPIVFFDGKYIRKNEVVIHPDDRGFLLGDGVYDVIRVYSGQPFVLDAHLDRLAMSLEAIELEYDLSGIELIIDRLIEDNQLTQHDAVVYVHITRGVYPRQHAYPICPTPTVYIAIEIKQRPIVQMQQGVAVLTMEDLRWANPQIKTTSLMANCMANEKAQQQGAYEAIFHRDGVVSEGSHTSILAIKDGTVLHSSEKQRLTSITEQVIESILVNNNMSSVYKKLTIKDLYQADELFLVSTTCEITPITKIDDTLIHQGQCGTFTRKLQQWYDVYINNMGRFN